MEMYKNNIINDLINFIAFYKYMRFLHVMAVTHCDGSNTRCPCPNKFGQRQQHTGKFAECSKNTCLVHTTSKQVQSKHVIVS